MSTSGERARPEPDGLGHVGAVGPIQNQVLRTGDLGGIYWNFGVWSSCGDLEQLVLEQIFFFFLFFVSGAKVDLGVGSGGPVQH